MDHRNTHVLVVEDERELADVYARWLDSKYAVSVAYDGKAALDTVDDAVDVLLLDRRLPDLRGGEVLDCIRERNLDCRIAMITAVDPGFDIADMPFDDYAVKPVRKDELHTIVDRLVRLSAHESDVRKSFTVASKLSLLEREKTPTQLDKSEAYRALVDRLDALQARIETTEEGFDTEDFGLAYRNLDDGRRER